MPNKDGTGPEGNGPKTGRMMGSCDGAEPTSEKGRCGKPCGRRMGCGRRFQEE